jgi:hypothetical protein
MSAARTISSLTVFLAAGMTASGCVVKDLPDPPTEEVRAKLGRIRIKKVPMNLRQVEEE